MSRESRRGNGALDLLNQLAALDSGLNFESFLHAAGKEILSATGASAVGFSRRFAGAAQDFSMFIPREGETTRVLVPLDREQRQAHMESVPEGRVLRGFHNPGLAGLARAQDLEPRRVFHLPLELAGKPVLDIEVADPDSKRFGKIESLRILIDPTVSIFELGVVRERLRRERLESGLLHEVGRQLARSLDLQDVLGTILDLLRQVVAFDAAAIYILGGEGLEAVHHSLRGYDRDQEAIARLKLNQGIVGWVARSGEGEIVADVTADARYMEARPQTRSEMVVPLKSGGRIIGVFNLENDRVGAYNHHDLELLETFAGHAAAALERARLLEDEEYNLRIEQELRIARQIQRSFLPRPDKEMRGHGLVGTSLFSEEVSGDYYDFMRKADGTIAIALADVSGKGIPAALIMSTLRAAFRLGADRDADPEALCRDLNTFLYGSLRETEFVTGVFGFFDPRNHSFRYCSAGHEPPLLIRADGSTEWLRKGGMILGAFTGQEYEETVVQLSPGDLLLLYTDGVTEAHPGNHDEYGSDRLLEAARGVAGEDAREVVRGIVRSVRDYVGGPLPDDLTMVAIRGVE